MTPASVALGRNAALDPSRDRQSAGNARITKLPVTQSACDWRIVFGPWLAEEGIVSRASRWTTGVRRGER